MPRSATLRRGDCTVAYEEDGAGPGEPVVLLHGFGMSRAALRPLAATLRESGAAGRTVLADARGHGATRAPERDDAYGYPEMRDDLGALLEREAPSGAHLVGHSMGGQIALLAAIAWPERVRSLSLIAAGPCRAVTDPRERRAWERAAASFEAATPEELCASLASAAPTAHDALSPERLYGGARGVCLARVVRGGFLAVESNDEACRQVRAPCLVVVGDGDATWLEPSRRLAGLVPGSALREVPDAGHLVHLEHPEECAARIGELIHSNGR